MPKPIQMTNAVALELANLHGSSEKAELFRSRSRMSVRPGDGGRINERILVLNDLHIGVGRDPDTGRYYAGDDFTAAQGRQLISYLAREWQAAATGNDASLHPTRTAVGKVLHDALWATGQKVDLDAVARLQGKAKYPLTLCLNGDIFDFLQTAVERPGLPYPDGLSRDGKGPKNTPANTIVQFNMIAQGHPEVIRSLAVHLRLGHKIDYLPGNHDRHMLNEHVWSGEVTLQNGKTVGGFTKVIAGELRAMGAHEAEIKDCLSRLNRRPFAVYGDKMVEHGDMGDSANRVRRPYAEALDPTPLHVEMPMALGDYGVRSGFNALEIADPTLDAVDNKKIFAKNTLRHPLMALRLVLGFLGAAKKDGYGKGGSQKADAAQRIADIEAMVAKYPEIVDQLNSMRPAGEKLSREEVLEGLLAIEKRSATPFFSNFRKGSLFFMRLFKLTQRAIFGGNDGRSKEDVYTDRLVAANEKLGVNDFVVGHTHKAEDNYYLTADEKLIRYVNTHTWMDKVGSWGRPEITWGEDGKGVGVIEIGVGPNGKPWSSLNLSKVINANGDLVRGDLLEDPAGSSSEAVKETQKIFAANQKESREFDARADEPRDPVIDLGVAPSKVA